MYRAMRGNGDGDVDTLSRNADIFYYLHVMYVAHIAHKERKLSRRAQHGTYVKEHIHQY